MLVIGEALVDILQKTDGSVAAYTGGSPLNVAMGLARYGAQVTFATRLGDDDAAHVVLETLAREGVEVFTPPLRGATTVARGQVDSDGQADYLFESLTWDLGPADDELAALATDASVVHSGSLAVSLDPGRFAVLNAMRAARGRALVTFDPNVRPDTAGTREVEAERIEEVVALADVVRASDEDLEWLYPQCPAVDTARRWLSMGPSLVVVTSGGSDALAMTHEHLVTRVAHSVDVVDTVGAGDAVMAALISALVDAGCGGIGAAERVQGLSEGQVSRLLDVALAAGALAVESEGPDGPSREQLLSVVGPVADGGREGVLL